MGTSNLGGCIFVCHDRRKLLPKFIHEHDGSVEYPLQLCVEFVFDVVVDFEYVVFNLTLGSHFIVETFADIVHFEFFIDLIPPPFSETVLDTFLVFLQYICEVFKVHRCFVLTRVKLYEFNI